MAWLRLSLAEAETENPHILVHLKTDSTLLPLPLKNGIEQKGTEQNRSCGLIHKIPVMEQLVSISHYKMPSWKPL